MYFMHIAAFTDYVTIVVCARLSCTYPRQYCWPIYQYNCPWITAFFSWQGSYLSTHLQACGWISQLHQLPNSVPECHNHKRDWTWSTPSSCIRWINCGCSSAARHVWILEFDWTDSEPLGSHKHHYINDFPKQELSVMQQSRVIYLFLVLVPTMYLILDIILIILIDWLIVFTCIYYTKITVSYDPSPLSICGSCHETLTLIPNPSNKKSYWKSSYWLILD